MSIQSTYMTRLDTVIGRYGICTDLKFKKAKLLHCTTLFRFFFLHTCIEYDTLRMHTLNWGGADYLDIAGNATFLQFHLTVVSILTTYTFIRNDHSDRIPITFMISAQNICLP